MVSLYVSISEAFLKDRNKFDLKTLVSFATQASVFLPELSHSKRESAES
jgi:hypothetical protein